jgi:uncharacterized membrane protein
MMAPLPLPPAGAPAVQRARIASIDVMRGFIMLIMLFDHVRETFFLHMQVSDPMDVGQTAPSLFFTRLAAHVCAPMFVFLTGLSAWLYAHPASGARDATGFLLKRGALLIALELVVVNIAWAGQVPPPVLYLQVIWVIGWAMIALALLHRLPAWLLAALGVLLVAGHNSVAMLSFEPGQAAYYWWTLLLHRGFLIADGIVKVKVTYPLLPWIGVIALGYVAGPLYARGMAVLQRRQLLLGCGAACLLLLLLLRGFNLYGENLPWVAGDSALSTLMSFLNFTKYPPSLDFVLLTLGLGLLALAGFERVDNGFTRICATFGGAPMFYYLLHLYLLLVLQTASLALVGPNYGSRFGVDHIWQVWLIALALMPVLYFPCRAFALYKRRSAQPWVRYF